MNMIVFIVGNSRSGTTLMSSILGRHPLIYSFEELHFFERLYDPKSKIYSDKNTAIDLLMELLRAAKEGMWFKEKKINIIKKHKLFIKNFFKI